MGREPRTVIAIDAGSSNIRVAGARVMPGGSVEVTALGRAPSLGVRRGVVENIDEASYAVRAALEDAGLAGRVSAAEVYAGIGGKHIAAVNGVGKTEIGKGERTVSERDVARAIEAARATELGPDRRLLHQIPRAFLIDGYRCRRNPVGMRGTAAEAETHLVTASAAAASDVIRAVRMAGKEVGHVVFNGIAAALAALRPEEKQEGVILLDIGGGTIDIVGYHSGFVYHTSVLPLGGNQVANDIAIALNTAFHVGERVLRENGFADAEGVNLAEEITVPCFGLAGTRRIRKQYLFDVVRLRLTEMLQLALAQVRYAAPGAPPPASLVITGGLANLAGVAPLAERAFRIPTRIAGPPPQDFEPETLKNPAFAAIIGTLLVETDPLVAPVREERNGQASGFLRLPQLSALRT